MKLGLQIANFTYPNGPAHLAEDLVAIARGAEDAGFDTISVMDHLFQIEVVGPPENDMLEAYATLGFLAAHTSRVRLLTLVTAATYREPGLLAKTVSTVNVLSGGRAWLGIGAGWNADEAHGLGLPFPGTAERFERLEETLRICRQMWSDSDAPFEGRHYQLGRTLNSPQPVSPPKILVAGSGEKKTLRMVAKYADACNLHPGPELAHKLAVLREHCEREGTDYDAIEKTAIFVFDGDVGATKALLDDLHALGIETSFCGSATDSATMEVLAKEIVPHATGLTS